MSLRRDRALAVLAEFGITPAALAGEEPFPARLAELLAGAEGAALAQALGEVGTAATAARLAELTTTIDAPAARKALRRALFRLGQRGIAVPSPGPAATAARPAPSDIEGYVSGVDGRGDRMVWLVRALAGIGVLVAAAELNEPAGLRSIQLVETTRKQLRTTRARLERDTGLILVPADWRALDALLVEGQDRLAAADPGPRDWRRLRMRFTREPPLAALELRSTRVEPPRDEELHALARAAPALVQEPELRSWWPEPGALQPVLEELATMRASPLLLSRSQQEERIRAVLERAVLALFPPLVTARRLEATAFVLAESGRPAAARQALATARLLRERSTLAGEVPLVSMLVREAIAAAEASARARTDARGAEALVVTPEQALRARSPFHPRRTPG